MLSGNDTTVSRVFQTSPFLKGLEVPQKTVEHLLKRLKALRKKHELTQEQFAELSGIGYKYYQAVEGGRKRDVRLSTLERISDAYGIRVFQLLAPSEPGSKIPKTFRSKRNSQKK